MAMRPPQFSHLVNEREAGRSHHEYEEFAGERTVIRYDPRGTGLSERNPAGGQSLEAWVADLESVLAACGAERVVLDAISSSALTAIAFALRHPERVERLIIQNAFADGRSWWATPVRKALLQIARLDWELCSETWAWFTWGDERRDAMLRLAGHIRGCIERDDLLAMVEAERSVDLRDELHRVRIPAIVLSHGRFARMAPDTHNRELAAAIPGARMVEVHSTRERVAAIRGFLNGRDVRPAVPPPRLRQTGTHPLSTREIEVLRQLAMGLTNREIASELIVSVRTVDAHVRHIFEKTDSRSRAQAVAFAIRSGLLRSDE